MSQLKEFEQAKDVEAGCDKDGEQILHQMGVIFSSLREALENIVLIEKERNLELIAELKENPNLNGQD